MTIVAIIPARGGSKGIPGKNLKRIAGRSLVGHSVHHALQSKYIDRVIVSTDSEEIAKEARASGAEVPFMRPAELAEDHVLDFPVFEHTLHYLRDKEQYSPEMVVHLRPTAPYRKAQWIDEAIVQLREHPNADSIRSVSEPSQHPYRVFRVDGQGFLDPIMKHEQARPYLLRRQDCPMMYFYNCVIDIAWSKTLVNTQTMTGTRILPYIMSPNDVLDIDEPIDLEFARFRMEREA